MRDTSSLWRPSNLVAMLAILFGLVAQGIGVDGVAYLLGLWALVLTIMQLPAI